jgi:glycosyltransferase involved in cell wall biosynthesis
MRIGLYGGMANNMYLFAKALSGEGHDVRFIRDRGDPYPFSQPIWEDVPCTLSYDDLSKAASWTWEQWSEWERSHGWEPPNWLQDPLQDVSSLRWPTRKGAVLNSIAARPEHWVSVANLMGTCDVLLACGVEGAILAWVSGKPYVLWPHGGDIRMAARRFPRELRQLRDYFAGQVPLVLAYRKALWIGTHDAKALGGHVERQTSRFPVRFLGIPVQVRKPLPQSERRPHLARALDRLGVTAPNARHVGFLPARADFAWKGTDRLFRALMRIPRQRRPHLIAAGWGANYKDAIEMVSTDNVTFLPCAVSKPILYELYQSVDFVADQFLMGTYGTAAIEAMSCGVPVVMWIDEQAFENRGWPPPPVLNARTEDEISRVLLSIGSGRINLEEMQQGILDWVRQRHAYSAVVPQLVAELTAAIRSTK